MKCQRLEDSPDVDLRATDCADVKFLQVEVDKFLQELENLITRGWEPRRSWTFVEHIKDNENWSLSRQTQHLFQTFLQRVVTRLSSPILVNLVNVAKNVAAWTRASIKLGYKRKQQGVTALLAEIPKIEPEVGHDS